MNQAFDLTANPFHVLGVSPRSRRPEIAEAYELALSDAPDREDVLGKAQQILTQPKNRVDAEISWLLGTAPSRARELVGRLDSADRNAFTQALAELPPLDSANLAADLCCRTDLLALVDHLIRTHATITPSGVAADINSLRAVSGFNQVDEPTVNRALTNLRQAHAKAALRCIERQAHPGMALSGVVENLVGDAALSSPFTAALIREYDAWSEPKLSRISEKIAAAIQDCRHDRSSASADHIRVLLQNWDSFSQPVQLFERERGLDEKRSSTIYREVRDLVIWLANEHHCYEQALTLSKALLETFPELPSAAIQLSDDIEALERLVRSGSDAGSDDESLAALFTELAQASARPVMLCARLVVAGFNERAPSPSGDLFRAFAAAARATAGTKDAALPWLLIRKLAADLLNDHSSPEGAVALIRGLALFPGLQPPPKVATLIRNDIRYLERAVLWKRLGTAAPNLQEALRIVNQLLVDCPADERARLVELKAALEKKQKSSASSPIGYIAIAVACVIGLAICNDSGTKPKRTPRTDVARSVQPSTAPALPPLPVPQDHGEEAPPVGSADRVLTLKQLRYCLFERERLEALSPKIASNAEVVRFNRAVADYNSRCGTFRYDQRTFDIVQGEIKRNRTAILLAATDRLNSWRARTGLKKNGLLDIQSIEGALRVQERLQELGYYGGHADGIWGPASREALKRFKTANYLPADSAWDLETQTVLFAGGL